MPKLQWLEICGFRSFGERQRLDFDGDLALVWGPNSQGKTSIAEAIEFLLTGATIRRDMLGGAKAEFDACLRNVHLPSTAPVWVKAGVMGTDGLEHEVERVLDADYTADQECASTLTIDGKPVADLSALSIVLSDPPLRAPVLLQHSLRFALSARPQDRSNYFKSVLEVQDLEVLRDLIASADERRPVAPSAALAKLRRVAGSPELAATCREIEMGDVSVSEIDRKLSRALDVALKAAGVEVPEGAVLAARVAALGGALEARRERTFPANAYAVGPPPATGGFPTFDDVKEYNKAVAIVDAETDRLGKVFEALLAVPAISEASEVALDCPVCETPGALTPERVQALRDHVAATAGFRNHQAAAHAQLDPVARKLEELSSQARQLPPAAASLTPAELADHEELVGELVGATDLHRGAREALSDLAASAARLGEAANEAEATARAAVTAVAEARPVDADGLVEQLRVSTGAVDAARDAHETYAGAAEAMLGPVREAVDRRQGTEHWRALAELGSDVTALRDGLLDERARASVRRDLERAVSDIDKAKAKVFDEKFDSMSAEIDTWWKLLRPDEPVRFASVRRRGTGRRFVMFKAHLHPHPGAAAVERDALGVFSDSQLNALGLAAFLARARLQQTPLVVLDDPLLAGDDEHRATFVGYVLEKLLDEGVQVLVLTYDDRTSKQIHHRYEHLPVVGFSVSLERPVDGSVVVRTTNTAEALLQRAKVYLDHDNPEFRSSAAGKLRSAAERIAKEIIVKARTDKGQKCSLADHDDLTLGPLINALTPWLTEPSHAGKWKVVGDLLNPGSHDDSPPTKTDLKMAFGYLRESLKHYLRSPMAGQAE